MTTNSPSTRFNTAARGHDGGEHMGLNLRQGATWDLKKSKSLVEAIVGACGINLWIAIVNANLA